MRMISFCYISPYLTLIVCALLMSQLGGPAFRASGQSEPGSRCVIGMGLAFADVTINKDRKNDTTTGNVKFSITNRDCPHGDGNQVRVGVAPIDPQGVMVTGWEPPPPVNVAVPEPGTASNQILSFSVSGRGTTKFRVLIDLCNGQNCDDLKWTVKPNNVETNTVIF